MNNHKIVPEKVTRPIQLLAAWLTGLVIVDGAFLAAATQIQSPSWASGALVIAAIVNVPLFLFSIFVLQTKYRPEMQEDVYYSKYLEYQYSKRGLPTKVPDFEVQIQNVTKNIIEQLGPGQEKQRKNIEQILHDSQVEQIAGRVGGIRTLSEIFLRQYYWPALVERWKGHPTFRDEVARLIEDSLLTMEHEDFLTCKLTDLGEQVAKYGENKGILFAQQEQHKVFWEKEGCCLENRSRRLE